MPFYRFIIHGRGCFADDIGGFYTTRHCRAADQQSAARKIVARLEHEWVSGRSARFNRGGKPDLEVCRVWRIGPLDLLSAPNRGHSFYPVDDVEGAAAALELELKANDLQVTGT